jgi:hypothetical protein
VVGVDFTHLSAPELVSNSCNSACMIRISFSESAVVSAWAYLFHVCCIEINRLISDSGWVCGNAADCIENSEMWDLLSVGRSDVFIVLVIWKSVHELRALGYFHVRIILLFRLVEYAFTGGNHS